MSYVIYFSYVQQARNFLKPILITPGIPSNSKFPIERHCPLLSLNYKYVNMLNTGQVSRDAFKIALRKYLTHTFGSVKDAIDYVIEKFGEDVVLLTLTRDPQECFRSILAELINEDTPYEAKEVQTQSDILEEELKELFEE